MHITHLSVTNFKNIEAAELDFSPNLNCFVGDNGEGKTNLLDAIYYLSMAKSCFGGSDSLHIRHDAPFFLLQGRYRRHDDETVVACGIRRGEGKVLKRDNKTYDRLSDHLGFIPLVIISPADNEWINESGEERRKYLNTLLVQIDREYLHALTRYNHLLAQRNKLLKAPAGAGAELLLTLDEQLASPAELIYQRRKALVAGLQPYFNTIYQSLSGNKEQASLDYRSSLDDAPFGELLRRAADRDRIMQHTTVGVHRDDITMLLDGYPLRRTGSQGQQKTFLIALKLAQYEFLKHANGRHPLLLLDDIFDKLDERRVQQLITLVAHETFGQIFLTDSNKIRLNHIVRELTQDYCIFQTRGGAFSRLPNGDSEGTS
ncbi:MAG: DNA replication/repair protein RecF [Prevotellaceae bacterium]|jgi:DNA replication and repair protein RecF|nr:DNA replication/repair protein RecF [Prevotellaceae bacterium]